MSPAPESLLKEEVHQEINSGSIILPLFIALAVVVAALFVGEMLFGKNSWEVYQNLQENETSLEKKISQLKYQNATLQKEYFELKNIMPNKEDE